MTTQQPEALRLADEAWNFDCSEYRGVRPANAAMMGKLQDCADMIRKLHAENTTLQQGYAAARLEIESLQARIKTMAEEHADELMVAHMDGRMRAAQQEAQEPVAWYVTGCSRLLDEDEAKAEARHIGGTARAIPLYTVPQADSVLEDAARLEFEMQHGSAIAAARKQGANHG